MYIFSLLEHSIWTYISFLFSSLSLSRNLSKNSNFVRTRDTFIPIANDKCVVMLRAWQITPVFSVSFNFKDRSYFFPPSLLPMNHWIELRGRRLIRAVHYWKYRLFFRKKEKKKFRSRSRNAVWLSRVVMLHHEEKATVSLQSYETNRMMRMLRVWEKRLIEYIGRVISRD